MVPAEKSEDITEDLTLESEMLKQVQHDIFRVMRDMRDIDVTLLWFSEGIVP